MSHQALQRVAVRMLFDPSFAERVGQGERVPGLSDQEHGWLREVDARAWTVDHQRPARTLRELSAEFRGSCAQVVGRSRSMAALRGFFQSPRFHDCVQERGSLDLAFSAWLAEQGVHPGVLALEAATARCRRELSAPTPRLDGEGLVRAPGVGALVVDSATLPTLNVLEERLFELSLEPLLALAEDGPGLPELPPPSGEPDHLVLQPREGAIVPSRLGQVVCRTLLALERPLADAEFSRACGLPGHVAPRLLSDLLSAGLVVRR